MTSYGALPLTDERPRDLYPLAAMGLPAPMAVEVNLGLTHVVRRYYTQRGGLCVAYSSCQALTFFNGRLYHPGWSFFKSGGHPDTGAQTAGVLDILRKEGNLIVPPPYPSIAPEDDVRGLVGNLAEGIKEFRWLSSDGAQALQDIRTILAQRVPVIFVLPMFGHTLVGDKYFWKVPTQWAPAQGWHQILLTYTSDAEGIIGSANSWGDGPMFCSTYEEFVRLVNVYKAYGAVITDNITGTEGPMPPDPSPTPTPEPTPTPDEFPCPYCSEVKRTKRKLKRHIRRRHRNRA